jgi:predicted phosphate transport protein (TIGR00153 family)
MRAATLLLPSSELGSACVRLRIFPREESFFDLFEAAADNLAEAARLLLDMVEDFVDPEMKAKRLNDAEHEGDRLTHTILSRLNSTFITPFDREDIYALASSLDDVVDSLEAAADMMVLHRVSEPIDAVIEQSRLVLKASAETAAGLKHLRNFDEEALRSYWIRINELENEGDRLYRHARADLYSFDAEHPARYLLTWKDIVDEIERALDELEHVAHTVESIVLKNA